jgi:hypothetical protein
MRSGVVGLKWLNAIGQSYHCAASARRSNRCRSWQREAHFLSTLGEKNMSFWGDVIDVGVAVATGGLSPVVLDAAAGSHDSESPAAADPPASSALPQSSGGDGGLHATGGFGGFLVGGTKTAASSKACGCSRYELQPPFLLDNTTGDVWVYDEHTKHFGKVEVERSPVASAIENLIAAKVALELRTKLEGNGLIVNRAQYAQLAPFVDDTVKAVDNHLEKMRRP